MLKELLSMLAVELSFPWSPN